MYWSLMLMIFVAPEVLLGEGHDHNVDWWSYGVLVHLLLTGEVW